jgi:hypothetical protein
MFEAASKAVHCCLCHPAEVGIWQPDVVLDKGQELVGDLKV